MWSSPDLLPMSRNNEMRKHSDSAIRTVVFVFSHFNRMSVITIRKNHVSLQKTL